MAATEVIGQSLGGVTKGMGNIGEFMPYVLVFGVVFLLVWFFSNKLKYNKKILVWRFVNGRKKFIPNVKAKMWIDKNKVVFWKFNKIRPVIKISPPPDELIDVDDKGRDVVKCYITNNNDVFWIRDNTDIDKLVNAAREIVNSLREGRKEPLTEEEKKTLKVVENFKPISSSQRSSFIYQQEQNKKFGKTNLSQMLPFIFTGIFIIIVLIIIFMFFGKIVKPMNEAAAVVNEGKQIDLEIVKELKSLKLDIQEVKENTGINEAKPPGD